MTIKITGRVIERETGIGIAKQRVKTWDILSEEKSRAKGEQIGI